MIRQAKTNFHNRIMKAFLMSYISRAGITFFSAALLMFTLVACSDSGVLAPKTSNGIEGSAIQPDLADFLMEDPNGPVEEDLFWHQATSSAEQGLEVFQRNYCSNPKVIESYDFGRLARYLDSEIRATQLKQEKLQLNSDQPKSELDKSFGDYLAIVEHKCKLAEAEKGKKADKTADAKFTVIFNPEKLLEGAEPEIRNLDPRNPFLSSSQAAYLLNNQLFPFDIEKYSYSLVKKPELFLRLLLLPREYPNGDALVEKLKALEYSQNKFRTAVLQKNEIFFQKAFIWQRIFFSKTKPEDFDIDTVHADVFRFGIIDSNSFKADYDDALEQYKLYYRIKKKIEEVFPNQRVEAITETGGAVNLTERAFPLRTFEELIPDFYLNQRKENSTSQFSVERVRDKNELFTGWKLIEQQTSNRTSFKEVADQLGVGSQELWRFVKTQFTLKSLILDMEQALANALFSSDILPGYLKEFEKPFREVVKEIYEARAHVDKQAEVFSAKDYDKPIKSGCDGMKEESIREFSRYQVMRSNREKNLPKLIRAVAAVRWTIDRMIDETSLVSWRKGHMKERVSNEVTALELPTVSSEEELTQHYRNAALLLKELLGHPGFSEKMAFDNAYWAGSLYSPSVVTSVNAGYQDVLSAPRNSKGKIKFGDGFLTDLAFGDLYMSTLGVIAHELGHALDPYRTEIDYSNKRVLIKYSYGYEWFVERPMSQLMDCLRWTRNRPSSIDPLARDIASWARFSENFADTIGDEVLARLVVEAGSRNDRFFTPRRMTNYFRGKLGASCSPEDGILDSHGKTRDRAAMTMNTPSIRSAMPDTVGSVRWNSVLPEACGSYLFPQ